MGVMVCACAQPFIHVYPRIVSGALDYASVYNIESCDGYLISLSRVQDSSVLYSLDEDLSKVGEVTGVNPFPTNKVSEYHAFIQNVLQ